MKKILTFTFVIALFISACGPSKKEQAQEIINQADLLLESEKYEEALDLYNQALEIYSESSYAHSGRGTAYRYLLKYEQASTDLNKAIELDTNNYKAYRERGMVHYLFNKDNASALSDCKKSVSINSRYALGHLCLGYVYLTMGDFNTAYNEFSETIKLDSNLEWAYTERGYISYYAFQKYPEAIEDFTKAIELKPNWDYPYLYRAYSLYYMGSYTDAISDFQKVLSISNVDYYINESYGRLGEAYFYISDFHKAIEYFTLSIKNTSNSSELARLYRNRALSYDRLNDRENTIADLTKYLELDKSNSEQAMSACARLNYLTIWGSTDFFSFFFTAIAPPCSRNQGYSNNEDYSDPLNDFAGDETSSCMEGMSQADCERMSGYWSQQP